MFYAVADANKMGLKIADFDLGYTNHLYDTTKKKTLCGQYKNYEPNRLCEPNYNINICNRCRQVLKSKSNKEERDDNRRN